MRALNLFALVTLALLCDLAIAQVPAAPASGAPADPDAWLYGAGTMLIGILAGFLVSQYKSWREKVLSDTREDWRDLAVAFADRLGLGDVPLGAIELSRPPAATRTATATAPLGAPCPRCNPDSAFSFGDAGCALCHGEGYLPAPPAV